MGRFARLPSLSRSPHSPQTRGHDLVPLAWAAIWILGSAFMVVQVGFWNHTTHVQLQDVNVFQEWSNFIVANHALPVENSWQYPPGAAFLMLIPRIGGDFGKSFIALMLAFYMAGWVLMMILAERQRRDLGVWVWLLGMPILFILPILRFDLVPTVFAVAALVVIHRRPGWFGALAGIGAMVKVWPIVLLLGEWHRRRLLVSVGAALAAIALTFLVSGILFGDQTGFLSNQGGRGLQVEAVAASPWLLRQMITGEVPHVVLNFGTNEIESGPASAISAVVKLATLAILVGAALWWWARERAIRRGRTDLTSPEVSRDFVFTIILLLVITSPVLSPQYMIWLVGLSAVVLSGGTSRLARPAWIVVGAVVLTAGVINSPTNVVLRNLALLAAGIDAAIAMVGHLRFRPPGETEHLRTAHRGTEPAADTNVATR